METLNENDIAGLIKMQNALTRLRKREAANTASLDHEFADAIEAIHSIRQRIQGRCGLPVDGDID